MHGSFRFLLAVLFGPIPALASDTPTTGKDESPVVATIETTLSTAPRQIRQFAFDGDETTYFASEQKPGSSDHFTLMFDRPVAVNAITVITGRPDGSEPLDKGTLEFSADGKTFSGLATTSRGAIQVEPKLPEVRAIRIRPEEELTHPMVIRELTIGSNPPVSIFKYPVEFTVDVTDAPEMKVWAEKVARECERTYPMINEVLKSDGYKPPSSVSMAIRSDYNGVAMAGGGRITGSVKFFKDHPDDVGAMIHETTHIVQRYPRGPNRNPGWLVEGVADYVRFFKYEPGKIGRINAQRARYNSSYRVTAAFLAYVADKYDRELVTRLNTLMRKGEYKEEVFKELTGKTVQELDEEWRETLKR